MKKYIVSIACTGMALLAGVQNSEAVRVDTRASIVYLERAITAGYVKAFNKESVITESITYDVDSWNEVVDRVGTFIAEHNRKLKKIFETIAAINTAVITTLQVNFNAYIIPILIDLRKKEGSPLSMVGNFTNLENIDLEGIHTLIDTLQDKKIEIAKIIYALDKVVLLSRWPSVGQPRDALVLAHQVAKKINTVIIKAFKHVKELEEFLAWQK